MQSAAVTKPYKDRSGGSSRYRAVLMFRTVLILMAAVAAAAAAFPQISGLAFSLVCLAVILPALIYQIRLDNTLIHTGSVFVDDGDHLYVVLPVFRWGYGRKHHMNRKVKTNEVSLIESVRSIRKYPFGIAVRADVLSASSTKTGLDMKAFRTPGAAAEALEQHGKRKRVLFRIERGLREADEHALLARLEALENGPQRGGQ